MQYQNNKISLIALFASISIVLGFFENLFPIPIPGVKLGLSNIGIMLAIYLLSFREAIIIGFLKSIIIPIVSGNFLLKMSIGLPSTIIATIVMYFYSYLTKKFATPVSTGAIGAFFHIASQFIIIKHLFIKNLAFFKIFPYFSLLSITTGILTGIITYKVLKIYHD
ncbi:Gx transporter family protein [Deferribacter thermophilus]